ncbi:MAG: bifunctional pyr operon transcriptional regulator/uracil phosphoribosyltransferase PyrR [Pontibacterium sp.]
MATNLSVDDLLVKIEQELKDYLDQHQIDDPLVVGMHTGGVWIASHLHKAIGVNSPLGELNISFYRDDFTQKGLHPSAGASNISTPVENRHIILVDDVVMSGRTVRAAMNELFDFGRPASITLVCLIDIRRRQLPVQPDIIGAELNLGLNQSVKLTGPTPLALEIRQRTE